MRKGTVAAVLFCLAGPAAAIDIEPLARTCNNCHGVDGVSVGTTMPLIGGLPKDYLSRVMKEWKYDKRAAATMNRIVKGLSDDEIDALAAHFAAKRWRPVAQKTAAAGLSKGRAAVRDNCADCHGATGNDPDIGTPRLDGQWADYMALELEKYRDPEFAMPHRKMNKAIRQLEAGDFRPVSDYFGAQHK